MQMLVPISFLTLLLTSFYVDVISTCHQHDHITLQSFYHHISSLPSPPLNWSESTDCCEWEGIGCTIHDGVARVARLRLPEKNLSGTISPTLGDLPFLAHVNLSHNRFSGPLPLFEIQTLDLSFNQLSGPLLHLLPRSIQTLDISSNRFNGSLEPRFLLRAPNLMSLNISNNSFTGSIPTSSICKASSLVRSLDFSVNRFTGPILPGLGECTDLRVFRAGGNSLSGPLPYDLYNATTLQEVSLHDNQLSGTINNTIVRLSKLATLELHFNRLSGEIPRNIGLLSNLQCLDLHNNTLNGALPPSLMNCSKLTSLILRDNLLLGEVSSLDFSKLRKLRILDLGSNGFIGNIPRTLCSCTALVALRFSHNNLVGDIPPCISSLKSLQHLAIANNNFSNIVGAFKALSHCRNLTVLIMYASFYGEMMPAADVDGLTGLHRLQILTIGNCTLKGQIPPWIANLRAVKLIDLSRNEITGEIPSWLGSMPNLFILNVTYNMLSGHIPPQLYHMPALVADHNTTISNLVYLVLPMLIDGRRYTRLLNMRRVLAVGGNNLSGGIPQEIARLKLVQVLDLCNNNFNGSIPSQLSNLTNLETLNISRNRFSGRIPASLSELHFLSSFSVADNDLEGEVPRGGQFDTFSAESFEGNPRLCGYVLNKSCTAEDTTPLGPEGEEENWVSWYSLPFGLGFFVGLLAVAVTLVAKECRICPRVCMQFSIINATCRVCGEINQFINSL